MPYKNKQCKFEYYNKLCECEDCSLCPHYRPSYEEDKEFFYDLLMEQQEQM